MAAVNIPTCLWAQTKEAVYVTVDVPDVTDEKISVDSNLLKFSAKSAGKLYECEMELYESIDAENSNMKSGAESSSSASKGLKAKKRKTKCIGHDC